MLSLMGTSMDNMVQHLEKQVKTNPVVDMKPVFQSLTLDVIAKVAFGLESNTHETPNSELFAEAKKIAGDTQVRDTMTAFMVNLVSVFTGIQEGQFFKNPSPWILFAGWTADAVHPNKRSYIRGILSVFMLNRTIS